MAEQTWKWGWLLSAGLASPEPAMPAPGPAEPLRPAPAPPGPARRPWRGWPVLVLLVLIAASVGVWNARRKQPAGPGQGPGIGRTAKVFAGPFARSLRVSGSVSAKNFAAIVAPQMRGREPGGSGGSPGGGRDSGGGRGMGGGLSQLILMKLAPAGTHVKKGDVIAQFDSQWELEHIENHKTQVAQTQAIVDKRRAEIAIENEAEQQLLRTTRAESEKARLDLRTAEVRSAIDAEKLKLAVEETAARFKQIGEEVRLKKQSQEAEIRGLEMQVQQEQHNVDRHDRNIERMVVKAPIDGLVVMQSIFRSGQFGQIQEGDQVYPGMYFMQIVDLSQMVVNGSVNQVDSHSLSLGQKATVRLEAYPGLTLPGRLVAVGAMASGGARGYRGSSRELFVKQIPVRFSIDAPDTRVIPDLSASADVVFHQEEKRLQVPREAIFQENGKTWALVRQGEGSRKQEVRLGPHNGTHHLVLAGLNDGDEVLLDR